MQEEFPATPQALMLGMGGMVPIWMMRWPLGCRKVRNPVPLATWWLHDPENKKPHYLIDSRVSNVYAGGAGRSRTDLHGFAIRCITALLPRHNHTSTELEREKSLELSTSTLARLRSTN